MAVELRGDSFEILPEDISAEVAGHVVRGKLEWIHDAGQDRRARTLMTFLILLDV